MEKEQKIVKSFYMPESLFEWSKEEAERIGIPQNSILLQLIDDGRKYRALLEKVAIGITCPNQSQ